MNAYMLLRKGFCPKCKEPIQPDKVLIDFDLRGLEKEEKESVSNDDFALFGCKKCGFFFLLVNDKVFQYSSLDGWKKIDEYVSVMFS